MSGLQVSACLSLCSILLVSIQAWAADTPLPFLDSSKAPEEFLSAYQFFADGKHQIPNPGVVPYDLNTPHFADYATLRRFFWLPEGTQIHYAKDASLEFPIGSVLILTVSYPDDIRSPNSQRERLIETRLLIRGPSTWTTRQYLWDAEANDAQLIVAGGVREVSWNHHDGEPRSHRYHIPNRNQCKQCHEIGDQQEPLGPVHARHVNRLFHYADGPENQLQRWTRLDYLSGTPDKAPEHLPKAPVWNDPATGSVDARARAYLDMNCSSCHRPQGLAYTSGLELTADQHTPFRFGVFKAPVAAGRGVGNTRFAIVPGKPEESMLLHRLRSIDPGIRMPIVGRSLVHEEGVALIRQWIAQMDYPNLSQAQASEDSKRTESRQYLDLPQTPTSYQP